LDPVRPRRQKYLILDALTAALERAFFLSSFQNIEWKMVKLGFIGAGIVSTALSCRLSEKGYPVVAVSSRSYTSANKLTQKIHGCHPFTYNQEVANAADLIFIATPDDTITSVVSQIRWRAGQSVVHCSGSASTDILQPAEESGAQIGAFHPLQAFASAEQALANIPRSTFILEAKEPLLGMLKDIVIDLDGQFIELTANDKILYHAAAVIVSNYLVTLVKLATDLWQNFGISNNQAIQALMPLIKGTINNIDTTGIPQCLTGPIARGDTGTVFKHIEALCKTDPGLLSTYKELGLQTIPIALAKGRITQHQARKILDTLKQS
jgi:predicted short-subunit dehydrogenase-like oxidoreductase (DUF2520 family)